MLQKVFSDTYGKERSSFYFADALPVDHQYRHAYTVLIQEGETPTIVLIYGQGSEHWQLPGGDVAKDETAEKAIHRHIKDRTGITEITKPKIFGISEVQSEEIYPQVIYIPYFVCFTKQAAEKVGNSSTVKLLTPAEMRKLHFESFIPGYRMIVSGLDYLGLSRTINSPTP